MMIYNGLLDFWFIEWTDLFVIQLLPIYDFEPSMILDIIDP